MGNTDVGGPSMIRRRFYVLVAVILGSQTGSLRAQTVIDNGKENTINGPMGPISVQGNGTALNVVSPGSVSGAHAIQGGLAIVAGPNTAVNMLGGQVVGSSSGIQTFGVFSAFGGLVQGADASADFLGGGIATHVFSGGGVLIGGGTFQGGDSTGRNGVGGEALFVDSSDSVTISGGVFRGGSVSAAGFIPGMAANLSAAKISISGGMFQEGSQAPGGGVVTDGLGAVRIVSDNFSISGGTFLGGGGGGTVRADVGLTVYGSGTISGGTFTGGPLGSGNTESLRVGGVPGSDLVVTGGLFTGPINLALIDTASASFVGTDLNFDRHTGLLSGKLLNGDLIDTQVLLQQPTQVTYHSGPNGEIATFAIPEPSSFLTMAIGIGGVALAVATKRLRRRS
jgi:hypothetical protein